MSLLRKAMAAPPGRRPGNPGLPARELLDRVELARAYADGRVTGPQAAAALGCTLNNVRSNLGVALLKAMGDGLIRIEVVK